MRYTYHLKSMPYANCHVEFILDGYGVPHYVALVSYSTTILHLERHGNMFVTAVNYPVNCSATTARHVNRFTTELYGRNMYHEFKNIAVEEEYPELLDSRVVYDFWVDYYTHGKRL